MKSSIVQPPAEQQPKRTRDKKKLKTAERSIMDETGVDKTSRDLRDSSKSCTAIEIDTIGCIAEQTELFPDHKLSDAILTYIADDVSHLVREITHNARIRMKHAKRRTLKVTDVDSAMESANIERIYGPANAMWTSLGDNYTIEDPSINLITLAFAAHTQIQDGPPYIKSEWLSLNQAEEHKYYECICKAVFSHDKKITKVALNNLKSNLKIGNVIHLFCSFCFFAFIADKGNRSIVLTMLRCIARNPCSSRTVPGNAIKLILTILVSELFLRSTEESKAQLFQFQNNFKEEVSTTITIILNCWQSLVPIVVETIQRSAQKRTRLPISVVYLICSMGPEITCLLFWDRIHDFLSDFDLEELCLPWTSLNWEYRQNIYSSSFDNYEFRHSIWYTAAHVFRAGAFGIQWERGVSAILGDAAVALYPNFGMYQHSTTKYPIRKKLLLKSYYTQTIKKTIPINEVFETYNPIMSRNITIAYGNSKPNGSIDQNCSNEYHISDTRNSRIIISKKTFQLKSRHKNTCQGHSLLFSL